VNDSSGNAGAAIAGYAAAAGIECEIYLPEGTAQAKINQIHNYGARARKIPGSRDQTSQAVLEAAKTTYYASHVYNPLFFHGTKTIAAEINKQVGVPEYLISPVGHGTMLLGLYLGFKALGTLPKIIAVQAENCAPVYHAYHGLEQPTITPTRAKGISVENPVRCQDICEAVRLSGGDVITVSDEELMAAKQGIGQKGLYIEDTSAVPVAGAIKYFQNSNEIPSNLEGERAKTGDIVIPLTGSGLKDAH